MEIFVDDETKLTLHGLQQYYVKLKDNEKNRKLFDLLDALEFNQVLQCVLYVQPAGTEKCSSCLYRSTGCVFVSSMFIWDRLMNS